MYIKARFIKDGKPSGREYVYKSEFPVEVGDTVRLPSGKGIVTAVGVAEEEVAGFANQIKSITEVIRDDEAESV